MSPPAVRLLGALPLLLLCACVDASHPEDGGMGPDVGIEEAGSDGGDASGVVAEVRYGRMIPVPAGPFYMGCREDDAEWCDFLSNCCAPAEYPQHVVGVPTFYIDETEVTVEAYRGCVADGACPIVGGSTFCNYGRPGRDLHPVNCLGREAGSAFCAWAGKRLCSEAEWEKAARGGCDLNGGAADCQERMRHFPWGDDAPTCERAILYDPVARCGDEGTSPVGSRPGGASPYGALDMSGNALEWVEDCGHRDYDGAPTDGTPWTTDCDGLDVARGGSFWSVAPLVRAATRHRGPGEDWCCGVRCCSDDPM